MYFSCLASGDDLTSGYSSGDPDPITHHPRHVSSFHDYDHDVYLDCQDYYDNDDDDFIAPIPPPQILIVHNKKNSSINNNISNLNQNNSNNKRSAKVRRTQSMSNPSHTKRAATRAGSFRSHRSGDVRTGYGEGGIDDVGVSPTSASYSHSGHGAVTQQSSSFKRSRPGEVRNIALYF